MPAVPEAGVLGAGHRKCPSPRWAGRQRGREAVLALVRDPAVAERSAALRAELAAEGGTPYAAGLIEAELRSGR
ncbi:hypothetical protein [Streptomyces cinnamoneus]|uniref:hypothetical protein n=1 Tax=Streptomyces cinnamoneus TaxID=53446 RepID=UPI003F4D61D5